MPESAASSPRSSRTAGCRPRTRSRSSSMAAWASSCASTITCMASGGMSLRVRRARPRFIAREVSRCWAPSWRSRSIRRRSASTASTRPARLSTTSSIRCSSTAVRPGPSIRTASASSRPASRRTAQGRTASSATPPTVSGTSSLAQWSATGEEDGIVQAQPNTVEATTAAPDPHSTTSAPSATSGATTRW